MDITGGFFFCEFHNILEQLFYKKFVNGCLCTLISNYINSNTEWHLNNISKNISELLIPFIHLFLVARLIHTSLSKLEGNNKLNNKFQNIDYDFVFPVVFYYLSYLFYFLINGCNLKRHLLKFFLICFKLKIYMPASAIHPSGKISTII